MFPPIFDPFHRPAESAGGVTNENVLRVELAPDPETAAHVTLVEVDLVGGKAQHLGDGIPVVMRDLGGSVHPEGFRAGVPGADRPPGFHRYGAVPPDAQLQLQT